MSFLNQEEREELDKLATTSLTNAALADAWGVTGPYAVVSVYDLTRNTRELIAFLRRTGLTNVGGE